MGKDNFFSQWERQINNVFKVNSKLIKKLNHIDEPSMYQLFLVNNNKVPAEFYVYLLEEYLRINKSLLISSFNKLRNNGYLSYGCFTREIAESKITCISEVAQKNSHLIKCIMSKIKIGKN